MSPLEVILLSALIVVLGIVLCLGFYLGWFYFGADRGNDTMNATLTGAPDKSKQEKNQALESRGTFTPTTRRS
jgi:hypothetical protein